MAAVKLAVLESDSVWLVSWEAATYGSSPCAAEAEAKWLAEVLAVWPLADFFLALGCAPEMRAVLFPE